MWESFASAACSDAGSARTGVAPEAPQSAAKPLPAPATQTVTSAPRATNSGMSRL